jgi:3D (Asp-Asp-Asp) domain-containing protein
MEPASPALPPPPPPNPPQSWLPSPSGIPDGATRYRLVVIAPTAEQQAQVKQVVPAAFRTVVNGQPMMQVGLFRDRAIALSVQQQLLQQNLVTQILAAPLPQGQLPPSAMLPTSSPPMLGAPIGSGNSFGLPQPTAAAQTLSLWATYYYLHRAENAANGYPLLDLAGNPLGSVLSQRDWCAAALQGSVQVLQGQQVVGTYNYTGRGDQPQVDCSPFYPTLKTLAATNRVRFKPSNTLYGEGVNGYALVPYRTIAVDRTLIPIGSVLYIPEARGTRITLPSGQQVLHDGYFYAADVGNAIRNNQIDVFIGIAERNPFAFVQSRASGSFSAYLVNDPAIQAALLAQHREIGATASNQW